MQNKNFTTLPSKETVTKTIAELEKNGIAAFFAEDKHEAKEKVLSLISRNAEVMTMTSITLEQSGITDALNNSGDFVSIRKKLSEMSREAQHKEMQAMGATPEWAVGSVHAVTQDGHVLVASNTGSQLPAYVYGSPHVVWVVSTKKIVATIDDGMKRIYDHILPLESQRARKAYNLPETYNSFVSKLLIVNREATPNRITLIFVNEDLGF